MPPAFSRAPRGWLGVSSRASRAHHGKREIMQFIKAFAAVVTLGLCAAAGTPALAAELSGNPFADGWAATGKTSLDNGTYIRGAGNFAFDLYATSYALDPASSLIASTAADLGFEWLPGDQILGMGGIVVPGEPAANYGWGNVSGDAINTVNLTTSVRIVSKFGTSPASWSASSVAPNAGNGQGSSSAGHGGVGAILLGTTVGDINATNEGTYYLPTSATQYRLIETNVNAKAGRIMFDLDGGGLLGSWQSILNVSLLQRNVAAYSFTGADYPQAGDRGNQALQRSMNTTLLTDALVTVPEPGSALAMLALAAAAALRRARRARA